MCRRRPQNSKREGTNDQRGLLRRFRRLFGAMPSRSNNHSRTRSQPFNENEVHEHLKNETTPSPSTNIQANSTPQKPQSPVKLNLVPTKAPFFENAHLLLAADCAPIALKNFHNILTPGRRVIIGCPKFDDARAYAQKLTEILKENNIASVTVAHMEVPCCTGLKWAVNKALEASGKQIPVKEYEIRIGGEIVEL